MRTACFIICVLIAAEATARDIYVSNTAGDDRSTGHQTENTQGYSGPVRTIAKALRLANNADRIVLAETNEPYRESISLVGRRHSGHPLKAFTIAGNGAVLDGSEPIPPEAWENVKGNLFRFRPKRMGQQQLFIDDRPAALAPESSYAEMPPKLDANQWCEVEGYIYFAVEKEKIPADYNFTYAAKPTGITLYHVNHVSILGLTVQGFQLDGINAHNSARDVYISEVTARGNGRSGIAVGGASQVEIDISVLGNNGEAQLLTLPHSTTVVRNSAIFAETAPGVVERGGRVYLDEQSKPQMPDR